MIVGYRLAAVAKLRDAGGRVLLVQPYHRRLCRGMSCTDWRSASEIVDLVYIVCYQYELRPTLRTSSYTGQ